jgi:hypothetical protein
MEPHPSPSFHQPTEGILTMTKLTLTEPIQAHGKTVTELELRKPLGGDIRKCGTPTKQERTDSGTTLHHVDTEVVAKLISEIAGIPPSSVNLMSAPDFMEATGIIVGFFNQPVKTSSTDTSNSPGSSETSESSTGQ